MTSELKREFQELWTQTSGKLRAYMYCASESWPDADDMTQDCYLRALRGWNQFDGRASRQAWLFAIARRTRVDWFRRKKREGAAVERENLDRLSKVVPDKPNTDNIEKVWEAARNLKAEHSQVIHMRFAAGLSYAEIAQALDVPIGTVRSRLHRGLKGIREEIGELENET
jgi:RNA polymerase sigma-70 factor (ECF subfamily)